ncbi:lytic transglycosylase domain-containing protein [Clostridium sp. E02]|uniref:lytic transglycosylase domain-containing protein n=1 Tax=Clostridium sp. E02 TaxID=2487134 RepID=UPI001FAA9DC6|nr:lytic transglycosylase domain-containing protein [Clostridium sp. E02]
MVTIDQLRLSALAKSGIVEKGYKAANEVKGSFKRTFQSALNVPSNMESMFQEASKKYGVSTKLLKAVAKAESNFNASATSPKGAAGIMQLMPATARALGVSDPYDARSNIMGGAKYLKENLERYNGDVKLTLAAYNAGSNNVRKYGGVPPFKETQEYVKKIMKDMGSEEGTYDDGMTGNMYGMLNTYQNTYQNTYGSYDIQNAIHAIYNLTGTSGSGESSEIGTKKEDYLYLVELMKLRMQTASHQLSNPMDFSDKNKII